jgi:hypothetical protein
MKFAKISLCLILTAAVGAALLQTASQAENRYLVTAAVVPAVADKAEIVEDSMHEFMEYVFQPTYRRLKVAMASEPQDNAGWKAIKSDSLILAESCNLLFVRTPEEDGADWDKYAAASRNDGGALYQAARAKDFAKATTAYKSMLDNCNACHRQFEDGKHILAP